jgi:hypothetical protein
MRPTRWGTPRTSEQSHGSFSLEMSTMITTMNLRADAEAEAGRLTIARSLGRTRQERVNDTVRANGPLIARARGAHRRKALAGRTLFIWQVASEDAAGRRSPAAIVAILVSLDFARAGCHGMSRLRPFVDAIDASLPEAIRRALSVTERAMLDSVRAHAVARLARERAIGADVAQAPRSTAYQAGLFERRSERDQQRRNSDAQRAEQVSCRRVDGASAAATVATLRPALLLVLTASS